MLRGEKPNSMIQSDNGNSNAQQTQSSNVNKTMDKKRVRLEQVMSNEALLPSPSPTGSSNFLAKRCDSTIGVKKGVNKSDIGEAENVSEEGEFTGKKRECLRKEKREKNVCRINRIHIRRGEESSDKSPPKAQKEEEAQQPRLPASENSSQEDVAKPCKTKWAKKSAREVVSTSRIKKKIEEMEKSPDSKPNPRAEREKKNAKARAITAFGSTFYKVDPDPPPLPRKRISSSTDRFRKGKCNKSKDTIAEESGEEHNSSQCQLRPSTRHSSLKMSISKNKLTEMLDDKDLEKGNIRGTFESATGKRPRSPCHPSSKVEDKRLTTKVRMEGDHRHANGKQDEKSEIGKDLSFFERIQQNVRSYFNVKGPELVKFEEEEKKVQEGEHPENDENVMIWNDERIDRGFEEDFMKGDQNFFVCIGKGEEKDLDTGCKTIANECVPGQKSARGNGSGPGGKVDYSYGDTCKPSTDYECRRLYYVERRNCTEKPRTGSFHRSKTFQKNGLASSAPISSTSIRLILEPDEQVENVFSPDGMVSALTKIQELHQEINPNEVRRRADYARGTRYLTAQEDDLTQRTNCTSSEVTAGCVTGGRIPGCRTCRTRPIGSLRKRTAAVAKSNSATSARRHISGIGNRTKSEGSIQTCSFVHSAVPQKDISGRTLPNEVKIPGKQDGLLVPIRRKWFVYSVTTNHPIQANRQESTSRSDSHARNAEQSGTKSECKKAKSNPIKHPAAVKKAKNDTPSVTLKEIINLLRTVFRQTPEKVPENKDSGETRETPSRDADDRFAMRFYLEKLMDEKRSYLNLEKTKKLRKAQKANFISDSFNFFNLLNQEFLSLKSSDPRVDDLRSVIAQKKETDMEEYLDLYKKVIRVSLSEPEQYRMERAKRELERYTDMYYDLMKRLCLEKEGKGGPVLNPSLKSSEKPCGNINYEEVLTSKIGKSTKKWDKHSEKAKPHTEKSNVANTQDRTTDFGRRTYRTNNPKINERIPSVNAKDHNMDDLETEPVVEILSPQKSKGPQQDAEDRKRPEEEKDDPSSKQKIFLALNLCDVNLTHHAEVDGFKAVSDGKDNSKTFLPLEGGKHESSEALPEASEIQDSQSGCVRENSDLTVYPKSSIYEDDSSENQEEEFMLKYRAFRKILSERLQHYTVLYEAKGEDKRQGCKTEREKKSLHKTCETLITDKKKDLDTSKTIRKHKCETDPKVNSIRGERMKEHSYKRRSSGSSRLASSTEKEDTTKNVPWWRKDNFPPPNSAGKRVRKSGQARNAESHKSTKRTKSKTMKDFGLREDKKKRKTEMQDEVEEEPLKGGPIFVMSPEFYFERRFGLNEFEELLKGISSKTPELVKLLEGKQVCTNEEEERELRKSSLSGRDENSDHASGKEERLAPTGQKTILRVGVHNTLKTEWTEEPSPTDPGRMDYQKVAEVLNQFLGSVAEVWKAAAGLKDVLQLETSNVDNLQLPQNTEPKEDTGVQVLTNRKTIESCRLFLRILTSIFEDDPREEAIRKQLSLLREEFSERSHEPTDLTQQCENGERTRFVREVAEISREMREMIADELNSHAGGAEDMEPALFLAAIKKICEKLKSSYSWHEFGTQNGGEISECCQLQKIYYRPAKAPSEEGKEESEIKSNLGNLAEKVRQLCGEKDIQESMNEKVSLENNAPLDTSSSIYFDAADTVLQSGSTPLSKETSESNSVDKVTLSPIDESYFSLNADNFEKYRSLLYDKIITFLGSDDPRKINYGIALLSRMMDRDEAPPVEIEKKPSGAKDERERKWQDLHDRLMETCQVIGTEMKMEVEKYAGPEHEDSEKKTEIGRTCEFLKSHVDRMKSLIKEMKMSDGQYLPDDPVKALDNSRETNKERQLVSPDVKLPVKRKDLLENAMDFLNSIGNIGSAFDKFPFFPKCFGGTGSAKDSLSESDAFRKEASNELLLEGNKTMVKSLRKNIEKRQRKIQSMIEEAGKGVTRDESAFSEKITRKVRDLRKYYHLLEKMICDPTHLPPKWLKLKGLEDKTGAHTKKDKSSVMTMLEDLMKQASAERATLKYSRSTILADSKSAGSRTPASVGSLKVKIKCETLNVECPARTREVDATKEAGEETEIGDPLCPITA